ncbi:hypothetical protein K5B08_01460, partial [Candidatus Carsonella ruddii]|nr:hypothetical protein [Candidatus Carsonella ruddii]
KQSNNVSFFLSIHHRTTHSDKTTKRCEIISSISIFFYLKKKKKKKKHQDFTLTGVLFSKSPLKLPK